MVCLLTDKQITTLKKLLLEQKAELTGVIEEKDQKIKSHYSLRDSVDELSTVDNHPADLGTELYDREKDMALAVHGETTFAQIDAALEKINKGTYGVCETCAESIPYERLEAIPFSAYCVEHSKDQTVASDRPIEESVILPPVDNSFSGRESNDSLQDNEDSFRLVAQYGNSDTPSDFQGDYEQYNDLYADVDGSENFSELDELHVSEFEVLNGQISQEYAAEASKTDYLEDEHPN